MLMCNKTSEKLNSEMSFFVKFGIYAPQVNFLFYSIIYGLPTLFSILDFRLCSMWQRDMGVESIELPPWACRHILKVLIQSTQSMPAEMAKLSGFNVSTVVL